ncbi:DUF4158 domain-containing protein [Streptomyces sp. NBS 14/10]|nr:DUF4158 domain-containing protein [Streptomyces sp. NBS 14/10]KAK1180156.1 DUF4158 domain-containing protein [Streptomyces sp. NBS 14/10]
MCTVRYVGLFLEDPLAVPWPVIEHLGQELASRTSRASSSTPSG